MPSTPSHPPEDGRPAARRPRGERLWHGSIEPIFLISGQRRLIYVNPAWEKLTGVAFTEARGRVCRRRSAATASEPLEQVLSVLAPTAEALQGRPSQVRRRAPGKPQVWWEVDYFPWASADGVQGILGKIRVIQDAGPAHSALPEKLVQLRNRVRHAYRIEAWTSEVCIMQRMIAQMRLAAQSRLPVLICGPPGSGKEWAARTIHQLGEQRESFFATFDARLPAAALTDLLSSCKHWRIGTVYIKGLERLPRDAQTLLVQRLETETAEPEPRLMAGTSANMDEELRAGRILPELHARLTALTIHAPSLSQRLQDLPHLLNELLPRAAEAADRSTRGVHAAALERLRQYAWPGNVAELYDVLVQACRRAPGDQVQVDDLPFYLRGQPAPPDKPLALDETLLKVERRMIELAMSVAQGNKTNAAELLGIWRARLIRRLEQLGMNV